MAVKIKELNDDALIDVTVNKGYYMMLKNCLLNIFKNMSDEERTDEAIKTIMQGDYAKMSESQRLFFTLTVLVADIENRAIKDNLFKETEVLEPGDEGYVEPTEG